MYFIQYSNYKYVKGHRNNPQTPRILPRRDHAPGFEIPGSAMHCFRLKCYRF